MTASVMFEREAQSWVVGVDGCSTGWAAFAVNTSTQKTAVKVVDVVSWLRRRPEGLAVLAIDIPIGLLDGPRLCDQAARRLLGSPRCSSVFSAPCRAALEGPDHACASRTNRAITRKGLSIQAWGIAPKIKEIDDAIVAKHQTWIYEVHPEVSFWRLNNRTPMVHSKSRPEGRQDRLALLKEQFPEVDRYLSDRPRGVGVDDLLDAAVAAWTGLRIWQGAAESVSAPERDAKNLAVGIQF
jgi:predicted RNase H-like nuclease